MPNWTSPRDWTNGETPDGDMMDAQIRDNLGYLKDSPTFDGDVTITGDLAVGDDTTITGDLAVTGSFSVGGSPVSTSPSRDLCQGRLTLTTGVPVTTADVTAAGTLYWAPYKGNDISLYSGTAWVRFNQAQLSVAVPAAANQVYDAFVDYNSGTPALTLTAWASDTARATALTTQDGVLVLTGSTGKRYVGTVRTVTASQLNDSFALRHVWNYYHRLPRPMRVVDATNSWTYDSGTYQQANAAATNQLDCVVGVAEVEISIQVLGHASHNAGTVAASVGIGENVTNASTTGTLITRPTISDASSIYQLTASLRKFPAIGRNFYAWLESGGGATTTWYGDNNSPTLFQSGIHGSIDG
jgi:hypothetical protein